MFAQAFFPKTMFAGAFFPPNGEITPPDVDETVHVVGMLINFGTMMGRR